MIYYPTCSDKECKCQCHIDYQKVVEDLAKLILRANEEAYALQNKASKKEI